MVNRDWNEIKKRITNQAQREYNLLCEKVNGLNFCEALKTLDGFNLEEEVSTFGENNEVISSNMVFDYSFKHIRGAVFSLDDGGIEIWDELCYVEQGEEVAWFDITYKGEVQFDRWMVEGIE